MTCVAVAIYFAVMLDAAVFRSGFAALSRPVDIVDVDMEGGLGIGRVVDIAGGAVDIAGGAVDIAGGPEVGGGLDVEIDPAVLRDGFAAIARGC